MSTGSVRSCPPGGPCTFTSVTVVSRFRYHGMADCWAPRTIRDQWTGGLRLDVEESGVLGIALDERPPGFHVLAHEHAEQLVGLSGVVERHLQQDPAGRIHRGFPQLARVHLAEPLEPLHAIPRPGVLAALSDARFDQRV